MTGPPEEFTVRERILLRRLDQSADKIWRLRWVVTAAWLAAVIGWLVAGALFVVQFL